MEREQGEWEGESLMPQKRIMENSNNNENKGENSCVFRNILLYSTCVARKY